MSEFLCFNNHIIPPDRLRCPICQGKAYRMDGQTSQEWREEANEEEALEEKDHLDNIVTEEENGM
jgi:hypothetical protein